MDAATDSKVEVKGTMKCTDEQWNAIFKRSKPKETEEVDDNNE